MKKRIILIILLFAIFYIQIKAQNNAVYPKISDKISSNNEKLNLNTGAVSFSVPIWDAEQYGLHIPVSVSYNSNGIKANQPESLLGSWSLNIGGSVSVEQRGLYDRKNSGDSKLGSGFYYSGNLVNTLPLNLEFVLNSVHKNNDKFSDTEPDIFYYNFPGASGKFLFNNNGELVNLTDKSINISYNDKQTGIITDDEITIINNNGIKYYFECTGYTLDAEDEENVKSSPFFSLYKVEDLNTDNFIEITFRSDTVFNSGYLYKAKYVDDCESSTIYTSNHTSHYYIHQTLVEKIETNTSITEFTYPAQNDNLIITVSLKTDNEFKPYLRYRFRKKYFGNINNLEKIIIEYNTNYNSDNSDSIWESKDKGYKFEYRGGSGGIDFWGYDNGKNNDIDSPESYTSSAVYVKQLKKITFPKGNSLNYEFELNRFSGFDYPSGAGLRVSRITEKDEHNKVTSVTDYDYTEGKLTTPPIYSTSYVYTAHSGDNSVHFGHLTTTTSSPFMLGESYVNYSEVTEYIGGKDNNTGYGKNGKIKYTFNNENSKVFDNYTEVNDIKELFGDIGVFNYPTGYNVYKIAADIPDSRGVYASFEYNFPYKLYVDKADINGLLKEKQVFDNLDKKISETEYQYNITDKTACTGLKVFDYLPVTNCYFINVDNETFYHGITFYKLYEYKIKLNKVTERIFDKNDETKINESSTSYNYSEDSNGDLIIESPVKEETRLSNGDSVSINYYYPHNYSGQSSVLNAMSARNIKTKLIKTETFKNNELISGQNTVYRFKQVGNKQVIVPDYSQISEEGEYKTVNWFDKYDNKLRLLESHGIDSIHNSVIYNTLGAPIATVVNAGSDEIFYTNFEENGNSSLFARTGKKSFNGNFEFTLPDKPGTYNLSYWKYVNQAWKYTETEISNPGNGSSYTITDEGFIDDVSVLPTDALMTSKTSVPGIGVTSVTDANGISVFSEYDKFNRLSKIYNQDKNIIKKYEYNEANLDDLFLILTYSTEVIDGTLFLRVNTTVSGGSGAYSYSWNVEHHNKYPIVPGHDDFLKFPIQANVLYNITCTVTDASGNNITKSLNVNIKE